MDLSIKNAWIVTSETVFKGSLYVNNGKVAAIAATGEELMTASVIVDAEGKYLIPGVVDPHVHGGYGSPEREDFLHVGKAAAAGGVTTILEQPLSYPPTVTESAFRGKQEKGAKEFIIDYGFWGGLVPDHLNDMKKVNALGAGAFKSFMCKCSNYPTTGDILLLEGLQELTGFGGISAVHAEDENIIQELLDRFEKEGRRDVRAYLESHPPISELKAIMQYIFIAKHVPKSKTHVVHCSIAEGIEAIHEAKMGGLDITVETCPQYLALCEDDLYELGGVAKCDPPVRSRENVEKMWELLKSGKIDMVASDHSPHPFEKKIVPLEDFPRAAEGVTGIQTMLPVMLTDGVHKRGLPITDMVNLLCTAPSKRFGLWGRKGALSLGFDADFVILDLDKEWKCKTKEMFYLNKQTPYAGRTWKGYIESTWVRGTKVYEDGKFFVEPGFGRFYPMHMDVK